VYARPIATNVVVAASFYPAEVHHQDHLTLHPGAPYIATFDIPKIESLQTLIPRNWPDNPTTIGKYAAGG
jgi:peptide-methionine (S)-S-oxide reductase